MRMSTVQASATSAAAQDRQVWLPDSSMILHETDAPGAAAAVTFKNSTVHSDQDVAFDLTLNGFTVTIVANLGRGLTPDRFEVIPPDGYYALPQFIDVPEHEQATILIYPYLGG